MDTFPTSAHLATSNDSATDSSRRLRIALRMNAGFSTVTGAAALIAAPALADLLGIEMTWLIRLTGAGLLGFAVFVALVSSSDVATLRKESLPISVADFGWVLGTVALIATGLIERNGAVLLAVLALIVLDLGLMQLSGRRRLTCSLS